jgi:hypothetical protein
MTGLRPLAELNTKLLVKALTVLKAFKGQQTLCSPQTAPSPSLLPLYPNSPPGARAPIQMWVPQLQLQFLLLPFQITPTRINAMM